MGQPRPRRRGDAPGPGAQGEPTHTVGLLIAGRALAVFTAIAEAAGPNLNNATFAAALDELGEFALASMQAASLGAGRYDAEHNLRLSVYNPDAADDEASFVEFTG